MLWYHAAIEPILASEMARSASIPMNLLELNNQGTMLLAVRIKLWRARRAVKLAASIHFILRGLKSDNNKWDVGDHIHPDIVYNYSNSLWHCCGTRDGNPACDEPMKETFQAPPPVDLPKFTEDVTSLARAPPSISSVHPTTKTITSIIRTASGTTSPASANPSHQLDTAAKAGVGIGASMVFLIFGIIIWYILAKRLKSRAPLPSRRIKEGEVADGQVGPEQPLELLGRTVLAETLGSGQRHELNSAQKHELAGNISGAPEDRGYG